MNNEHLVIDNVDGDGNVTVPDVGVFEPLENVSAEELRADHPGHDLADYHLKMAHLKSLARLAGPSVKLDVYRESISEARDEFANARSKDGLLRAQQNRLRSDLNKYNSAAIEAARLRSIKRGREAFDRAYGLPELIAVDPGNADELTNIAQQAGNSFYNSLPPKRKK